MCESNVRPEEELRARRYLEDLQVGEITKTHSIEMNQTEMINFALRYDPQSMHTDVEAAAEGPFGGLIASGWYTAVTVMRLMVDSRLLGETPLLGLGVENLRWPAVVRPGDTISAEIEVASITRSRSKPDFGVVRLGITARNQNGEIVFVMTPSVWVPSRTASI